MKKQVFLLFAALFFSQAVSAQKNYDYDFSAVAPSGQTLYYNIASGGTEAYVTYPCHSGIDYWESHTKPTGNLIIPDSVTYNGTSYLVTVIRNDAFRNCNGLTSVTIPNTVTAIWSLAFYDCSGLTSATISYGVTSIGSYAFGNCKLLTSVTIPNSVIYIGNEAFMNCSGLTSVTIPNSVTSIGEAAFYNCTGMTSVTIPNSFISIGEIAFYKCSALTSVTIPNSVTSIGPGAFQKCSGLQEITFLNPTPPDIGDNAFLEISSEAVVNIPCGSLALYAVRLPYITNFVEQMFEFSAMSNDESKGTVQILTEPSCTNHNAVLYAVPADGYHFDHWSTGSTENPYTLTVTTDTTIIGYFVSNSDINETEANDIHISVLNGQISVEGMANEELRVYDITGRLVRNHSLPSGVYLVKVGTLPARKAVVIR